ncbi:hypothetical protein [Nocardioides sp. TF02-7]|uniref:CIS tube protein n=1 Tax=Nocardioides sp. TF02-7 TaxID=2917724 RepID=UPI001F05C40E|nr:hypothetical protein [Nocardioides sp. TF02-7]UMG91020.1 hypothetical protein MF408_12365 [Nocardioides sp. TF02-7]
MPELEKAYLELEGGERVPCLYNPESLSVGRRNSWVANPMPGKGVSRLQYAGAAGGWMRMHLWFDTTADGSPVTRHTGKIMKLMDVDPDLPGADPDRNNARPPTVVFHWGDLHSFRAVVSDLRLSFTYFSSGGVPLRAEIDLELRQYESSTALGPQNPTSGTPARAACTGSSPARRSTGSARATTATRRSGAAWPPPTGSRTRSPCVPVRCWTSRGRRCEARGLPGLARHRRQRPAADPPAARPALLDARRGRPQPGGPAHPALRR